MDAAKIINDRASAQCIGEKALARQKTIQRVEQERQKVKNWVRDQLVMSRIVADKDTSPATIERQLGRHMTRVEFERQVQRLNPAVTCEANPRGKNDKCASVYWLRAGKKYRVGGCERDIMPEYSVMELREVEIPIVESHISSRDMAPMIYEKTPGAEQFRGWRTVLIQLIAVGAITVQQAESQFGKSDRASWAHHLGKHTGLNLPF